MKQFSSVRWRVPKCLLSVRLRVDVRLIEKITEKKQEPTPDVRLREVSVLKRCPSRLIGNCTL